MEDISDSPSVVVDDYDLSSTTFTGSSDFLNTPANRSILKKRKSSEMYNYVQQVVSKEKNSARIHLSKM